jgi:hypothetical protein
MDRRKSDTARYSAPRSSIVLMLAEPLTVRSVTSARHGYLMALRVSGQDDIIINLPDRLSPTSCSISSSCMEDGCGAPPEREAIAVHGGADRTRPAATNSRMSLQHSALPSYIYTGRSMALLGDVTDYRQRCGCACRRDIRPLPVIAERDIRALPPEGRRRVEYRFSATQPVRYLGWATSKFVHVDSASFSIDATDGDEPPLTGASYTFGEIAVESSGLLQRRGRELFDETQRVMKFYGSIVGDIPYPSFTLAIVERDQPGGHSPPYFAALSHPPPATPISWRTDPAYFDGFPGFSVTRARTNGGDRPWGGRTITSNGSAKACAILCGDVRRALEERGRVPSGHRPDGPLDARPVGSRPRVPRLPHPQRWPVASPRTKGALTRICSVN